MEYKDPGKYIPIIYLLYSWGSRFGVPSKIPLKTRAPAGRAKSLDSSAASMASMTFFPGLGI